MLRLRQGTQSASQYVLEFRILESEWNDTALQGIFLKGVSEELKDELAPRDDPDSLEGLIDLTIKIDNGIRERRRERSQGQRFRPLTSAHLSQPSVFFSLPPLPHHLAAPQHTPALLLPRRGNPCNWGVLSCLHKSDSIAS